MSDDDYIDYCVMEAVVAKAAQEDREAAKKAEREQWKRGTPGT